MQSEVANGSEPPHGELVAGWRIIAVTFAGMMVSAPVLASYAIGSFVLPLQDEFRWARSEIQAGIIFAQGGCAICGLVIGAVAERLGIRRLAILGLLGVSAGFFAAPLISDSFVQYYAALAAMALLGGGSIPVIWSRIVTARFEKRRGFALALALTGTGLTGTLLPLILVAINGSIGWRFGFLFLAGMPLVLALPLVLLWLPRDGAEAGALPADRPKGAGNPGLSEAMRSFRFWILLVSIVCLYVGVTGILANVIPAMTSKGMSQATAATVQSGYAFSLIFGRLGVGWLVDRYWAPAVAALALTPAAIGSVLLAGEPSLQLALIGISLVGIAAGTELDLLAYLTSRYFGLRFFSSIYGVLYAGVAAAGASGPFIFAWVQERSNSYDLCFYLASGLLAVAGILLLGLGKYPAGLDSKLEPQPA
mgnify:CR=1 FL=1